MKLIFHFQQIRWLILFTLLKDYMQLVVSEQCEGQDQSYCALSDGETGETLSRSHLNTNGDQRGVCFRAAVVEHSRVDIPENCHKGAEANLDIYDEIARVAQENGVKMLVFPEDGIFMATKRTIQPCLEDIPDPETLDSSNNNPCVPSPPAAFQKAPILTRLSCIAKQYNLYLVANFGTRQQCDSNKTASTERDTKTIPCPEEGRDFMMLNTNVVFNPKGQFIKRYRKWHPFTESEVFDKAPKLEHTYFDTPYGRFGLFTCFDMIYRDPAVDLVEDYHIDTAIFPTWWFDEVPILTAVQFQDAWSEGNKVNLLASNVLKPFVGSTGSSIFSGNNSLYVSQSAAYGVEAIRKTKLLIANLDTRPSSDGESACKNGFAPKVIDIDANPKTDGYRHRSFILVETDKFEPLKARQGSKTLCSGDFCCTVDYKLADDAPLNESERIILIVRNGPRPGKFRWFEQVCALSVLAKPVKDTAELLRKVTYDNQDGGNFLRLSLRARFGSKYVYPTTAHDSSNLIERKKRRLACSEIEGTPGQLHDCKLELVTSGEEEKSQSIKIYSFAMYGRLYERDPAEII